MTKIYIILRNFIDKDLSRLTGKGSNILLLLIFPWIFMPLISNTVTIETYKFITLIAVIENIALIIFSIWRALRLFRAFAIRGDQKYDYEIKHGLAHDYAKSESRTKAKRKSNLVSRLKR